MTASGKQKTVIEELVAVLGVEVDDAGVTKAIRTFGGLHFLAKDLVGAFRRIGNAFFEPVRNLVETGEQAFLTSKRLGISSEAFQLLAAEAKTAGVDLGAMTAGLEKLGKSAYAATKGPTSAQAKAFGELGIRVTETGGKLKSNDKIFADTVDKLSRITDQGKQTYLAMQLMGRGAGQLLPLIQMGPGYFAALSDEIKRSGVILSDPWVKATREVGFWFKIAELHAQSFEQRVGQGLLPIAFQLIGTFLQLSDANRKWINQKTDKATGYITEAVKLLYYGLRGLLHVADLIAQAFGGWHNVMVALVGVLGFAFLAAVGQATIALGGFALSLLAVGLIPALFGGLLVALAIILDDVTSAHSAIEKLSTMDVGNSPLLSGLQTTANVILSIRDALKEIRDANPLVFTPQQVHELDQKTGVKSANRPLDAADFLDSALAKLLGKKAIFERQPNGLGITDLKRPPSAADFGPQLPGSGSQSVETRRQQAYGTVLLEQHFHGRVDPDVVKQAAAEGVSIGSNGKLHVVQKHNSGAQSGAR